MEVLAALMFRPSQKVAISVEIRNPQSSPDYGFSRESSLALHDPNPNFAQNLAIEWRTISPGDRRLYL
jgi:hypothetical protein